MNIPYRRSDGPLHLLIDSIGVKVEREGCGGSRSGPVDRFPDERNARKHGGSKRQVWRRIRIGIDEKTLEIRAAGSTTSDIGDARMLPEPLDRIPPGQEIASVTADGAVDTCRCQDAMAARGAAGFGHALEPIGPMPHPATKSCSHRSASGGASGDDGGGPARHRSEGRSERYHHRSRAETGMHCLKLLGQRLSTRTFDRQVTGFEVRGAVLNGFTALGIPATEAVG